MVRWWRDVIAPREHGAWGFWFEPVLAGLIAAWSPAGAALGGMGLALVLARRPVALGWGRRRDPAGRFAAVVLIAVAAGAGAYAIAAAASPVGVAAALVSLAVMVATQQIAEHRATGRSLTAQLTAALAMAALGPAIVMAGVGLPEAALAVGLLIAGRQAASLTWVRHRLRRSRGDAGEPAALLIAHLALLMALGATLVRGGSGFIAIAAVFVIVIRTVIGLQVATRPVRPRTLGLIELTLGVAYALAIGYDAEWRMNIG